MAHSAHANPAGHILEVAEQMVGGSDRLKEAIKGKRVVVGNKDGINLYYFAKHSRGTRDSIDDVKQISRCKAISQESYDTIKNMINDLGWQIDIPRKAVKDSGVSIEELGGRCIHFLVRRSKHLCSFRA